mmetsp:Transcript_51989/g.96729  ORF Transcript_51989/g.96729 Transcript_51989/m.96729 type:complete len:231 (-) Transcript_51989:904-1596(-)
MPLFYFPKESTSFSRFASGGHAFFHPAEQRIVVEEDFRGLQREAHPGIVHEVAPRDVVVDAVSPPRPATEAESLLQAVPQVAAVGRRLRLVHHDSARVHGVGKGHDVVSALTVDARTMARALVCLNVFGQLNRVLQVIGFVHRSAHTHLLPAERKRGAPPRLRRQEKGRRRRDGKPGGRGNHGRGLGHDLCVDVSVLVPDDRLQLRLVLLVQHEPSLRHQFLQHKVVHVG